MDWSKAKNVLIIAFIITNIILIYNIEKDLFSREDLDLISNKYIADVERHLEENNIKLQVEIPREVISLPVLMVKYKVFDPIEYAEKLLGEKYAFIEKSEKEPDQITYATKDKSITIISNKKLIYRNASKDKLDYTIDDQAAIKISEAFLKENNLIEEGLALEQIYFGKIKEYDEVPLYKLVYHQSYKNKFLGESYIHVYINHRGVVGLEAMLLEYERTYPQKKRIIPATVALLRKMNEIITEHRGDDILVTGIEVGYYFNPNFMLQENEEEAWQNIASGTAFPSWKITLDNGKIYYVEAYKN